MPLKKVLLKILKIFLISLVSLILLFFVIRYIGKKMNSKVPNDGINKSLYVDIGGTKQWINIYGYDMMRDGSDYNLFATILFNPNYSLKDWIQSFKRDHGVYFDFIQSPEFSLFSLKDRNEYKVPYYNINGNNDYQTNYIIAQNYFNEIKAPKKEMYIMENTTHGLLESKSEDFSEILHSLDL